MSEFDSLVEKYESKTRIISQSQRYPKGINFSRELLDMLEAEYYEQYIALNNRKFHSNYMKGLSFKLDDIKRTVEDNVQNAPDVSEEEPIVLPPQPEQI